jgi:hypothetical protein
MNTAGKISEIFFGYFVNPVDILKENNQFVVGVKSLSLTFA